MKLLLDTANLEDIKYFNTYYPIVGVTTNPTILAAEGGDVLALLKEIRGIIGTDKELHVQIVETEYDRMIEEAHAIVKFLGKNTYVKIPATATGLKVTSHLSDMGIGVTVTAVLSAGQALLAANAGAHYVAPYVSRLENLCDDGVGVIADIADILSSGYSTEILAASFKTAKEVLDVALVGAHASTVAASVLRNLLGHTTTDTSIAGFAADWKKAFGEHTLLELIKG